MRRGFAPFIFLALAVVAIVGVVVVGGEKSAQASSSAQPQLQAIGDNALVGFDVLSVSQASFSSNNPDLNGDAILLHTVITGSAGKAQGVVTPDLLNLLTGKRMLSNFVLSAEYINESCAFDVLPSSSVLYDYFADYLCGSSSVPRNWDESSARTTIGAGMGGCWSAGYQLSRSPWYAVARLNTAPRLTFAIRATLSAADGAVFSCVMDETHPTCSLGDYGFVKHEFSGLGTQFCPAPYTDTGLVRQVGTSGNWQAVDGASLTSAVQANAGYDSGDFASARSAELLGRAAIASKPPAVYNCGFSVISGGAQVYSCTPSSPVGLPSLLWTLKASKVNVLAPYGIPELVGYANFAGPARQVNYYSVALKNAGLDGDSFDVALGGCGLQVQPARVFVGATQTREVSFAINGGVGAYVCNLTASSATDPSKAVSKLVLVDLLKPDCPFECCDSMPDYADKLCGVRKTTVESYSGFHYDATTKKFVNDYAQQTVNAAFACKSNACSAQWSCGDGVCAGEETPNSCSFDCGVPATVGSLSAECARVLGVGAYYSENAGACVVLPSASPTALPGVSVPVSEQYAQASLPSTGVVGVVQQAAQGFVDFLVVNWFVLFVVVAVVVGIFLLL